MSDSLISPIWEATKMTCGFCCNRSDYFYNLEDNLKRLEGVMEQLRRLKQHVETRVKHAETPYMQQGYKVTDWFERVDRSLTEAEPVIKDAKEEIRKKVRRWLCPKDCFSGDLVGKRVTEKLMDFTELVKEGSFDIVVERKHREAVDEMPVQKIVGLDSKFDEIWQCIENPSATIIALCGMGGVGKSTLLKKINNKFAEAAGNSDLVVIWVLVGKEGNVEKVQEAIRNRLVIPVEIWKEKSEEERGNEIFKLLKTRRFVLLLDDIWEQLNIGRSRQDGDDLQEQSNSEIWEQSHLLKIGVPVDDNGNGSKIIFTTRSREVCGRMGANETIGVECLAQKDALELFQLFVGQHTLRAHPEIPELAKVVARKCQGLPLALKTVGRAMASRTNAQDWKYVIDKLEIHQSRLSDMSTQVFPILKVSYDNLNSDTLKNCFLYFSMFPKVHDMKKDELIALWIVEGLLGEFDDICDAKKEGEFIISSLKLACLLERGESENSVKMHDVLNAMTLWLASKQGQMKNNVVVLKKSPRSTEWINTKRMSLWGPLVDSFSQIPHCDHLITLFVRETKSKTFPSGMFQFMPALRVLDFSDNKDLSQLPSGIGGLINLHYLNLSQTSIEELPLEIQKLINLEILLLNNTEGLRNLPKEVLSGLLSLQTFSMLFDSPLFSYNLANEIGIIEELHGLEHIKEICITISSVIFVQTALPSPKLVSCIRKLILVEDNNSTSIYLQELFSRMKQIERLELWNCKSIMKFDGEKLQGITPDYTHDYLALSRQQCFYNLNLVCIWKCPIKNVMWLVYARNLQILEITECSEIEEVLSDDFGQEALSSLTELSLRSLPKLRCICYQTLLFPCLVNLFVFGCPKLLKLPFESNSAKELKEIKGDRMWWDRLKWKDDQLKHVFSSKYYFVMQKIVLKLDLQDDEAKKKAMKKISSISGVESLAISMEEKKLTVLGDIDPEDFTKILSKSIHAEILSIGNAKRPAK